MNKTDYKFVTIANGRSDITLHEPIYKGLKKKGEPTPPEPGPEPEPDVVRLIEKYFPDPNFRAFLAEFLGINEGDEIPDDYFAHEAVYFNGNNINSLDGIEYLDIRDCELHCEDNNIAFLDLTPLSQLTGLFCYDNRMEHLIVLKGSDTEEVWCYENNIKGEAMDALIESLPFGNGYSSRIVIINTASETEGNVCTKTQVQAIKNKGWKVYDYNGGRLVAYEGSDPE